MRLSASILTLLFILLTFSGFLLTACDDDDDDSSANQADDDAASDDDIGDDDFDDDDVYPDDDVAPDDDVSDDDATPDDDTSDDDATPDDDTMDDDTVVDDISTVYLLTSKAGYLELIENPDQAPMLNTTQKVFKDDLMLEIIAGGIRGITSNSIAGSSLPPQPQTMELINKISSFGGFALAATTTGDIHVVYVDSLSNNLIHAVRHEGIWEEATVDHFDSALTFTFPDLALDSYGKAHLVYTDMDTEDIMYATNTSGEWVTEKIITSDGGESSIAVDAQGRVHIGTIFRYDEILWAYYVLIENGEWTKTLFAKGMDNGFTAIYFDNISIALGPNGRPAVAYNKILDVWMMAWEDFYHDLMYWEKHQDWVKQSIFDDIMSYDLTLLQPEMSVDDQGIAHILFKDLSDKLVYMHGTANSGFISETLFSDDYNTSTIQAHGDGKVDACFSAADNSLHFLQRQEEVWTNTTITETTDAGYYSAFALDKDGYGHAIYFSDNDLMYANNRSGIWAAENTNLTAVRSGLGHKTSLAVDNDGFIHIAYVTRSPFKYAYATNRSGEWVQTIFDEDECSSSLGIDLAVDSAGHAHIAYNIYSTGIPKSFRYATNASGEWVIQELTVFCPHFAIAVGPDDSVHIGYTDSGIWHMTNADGTWTTEQLTSQTDLNPAINLAEDGKVHISYANSTHKGVYSLHYITNKTGNWVDSLITDSEQSLGDFSSIVIDTDGVAHIVFRSDFGDNLYYAHNLSGDWTYSLVDSSWVSTDEGCYTDIGLDADGNIHTAYYGNTALNYAVFPAGWENPYSNR